MKMAKRAVDYAVKHHISLCMNEDCYYIVNPQTRQMVYCSHKRTAKSAIIMMQYFLQKPEDQRYWQ